MHKWHYMILPVRLFEYKQINSKPILRSKVIGYDISVPFGVFLSMRLLLTRIFVNAMLTTKWRPSFILKVEQKKFEAISKIVHRYLCIPASSAPVERLFSIAGKVFCPDRCRLTDKTFKTLMFGKCNYNISF